MAAVILLFPVTRRLAAQTQVVGLNRPLVGNMAFASSYAWSGLSATVSGSGPGPVALYPAELDVQISDATPFSPWRAPLPVIVHDGVVPDEVVTVVPSDCARAATCRLQATFAVPHRSPVHLLSATGGLQEAINDLASVGGIVVVTDHGGTAATPLPAVQLPSNILIEDQRGGSMRIYSSAPASQQPRLLWSLDGTAGSVATPDLDQTRQCDQFPGADASVQINNCIADLPSSGGVADARGFQGAQAGSVTIAVGSATKPVTLLLGAMTLTSTANPVLQQAGSSSILGLGGGMLTSGSGAGPASQIVASGSGATAVNWHGSYGVMSRVGLASASGDVLDFITTAADAAAGVSVDDNSLGDLDLHCSQETAHDALLMSGYNATSLVQFNAFHNLRVYGCLNAIHLTTTASGSVGPADNQWYGGQLTKADRTGVGVYLDANAAANAFYGLDIAGMAVGTHIVSSAFANTFVSTQFESNTNDITVDAGAADNAFVSGGGLDGVTDNGVRTAFVAGNYAGGPNGGNLNQLPVALSRLAIDSANGWPTNLTSAATAARTATFPDSSGTVALNGTALPLLTTGSFGSGSPANTDSVGAVTLSAGHATYIFTGTYATPPVCFGQDQTAPGTPVTLTVTTTGIAFVGAGVDGIGYGCFTRN